MGTCLSILGHVTELRSDISETISFQTVLNGIPVNVGIRIKDLQGRGLVKVNTHRLLASFRSNPELKIRVLVDGKQTMILNPSSLIMSGRIIFGCHSFNDIPTFFAKGLVEEKQDLHLRIRFRKKMRSKVYAKRENDPKLVFLIGNGEALLNDDDAEVREAIVAPSPGQANHLPTESLTYIPPYEVEGYGHVADISSPHVGETNRCIMIDEYLS